ncbi:LexA family transcriptional regulator [Pseudomonas sp. YH-1]|uniref:LexA family transcriptional regulator n=1 Tax=Pseudomonas sp. YH-1 TaxID=3384787 RepID=UPI003F810C0B
MKKRPLNETELSECAALKKIFLEKREQLGLTQASVAEKMGVSQTAVSMYMNGRNALNASAASQFAQILEVPVANFSPRIASMIKLLAAGVGAAAAFRKQAEAIEWELEAHGNIAPMLQPSKDAKEYPVISWVIAGERAESPDNYSPGDAEEWLPSTENAGPYGYWLRVRGKSMTSETPPSFPEGTPILVRPEGFELVSGKFYIAKHRDGETTFKQYIYDAGTEYLAPLNRSFKTFELDDDWTIIGRVIDAKIVGL